VFLLFLFMLHPVLGWLGVFGVVLLVSLTLLTERMTQQPLSAAAMAGQQATGFASNQLANSEVIQALGMLPALRARWSDRHLKAVELHSQASDAAAALVSGTKFVRLVLQSAVLGVGAYLVIADGLSGGGMIAASILMGRALAPIEGLIGNWKNLVATRDAWGRIGKLLQAFPARAEGMSLAAPKGDYALEQVTAVPPGSQKAVLRNLNFQLPAGQCLAVIGPSGSGKSSLARLLVGVWAPRAGTVRLDGADVYAWNKSELGPHLGYLPQDVELFEGSVAENIARFGIVDPEQVTAAAQLAGIHELVLRLPQGYDTQIGPGGGLLSGGQRQRLGLARAVYGNPQVIVLDEPNSNLDDVGEAALLQAISQLKARGRTLVVITHRRNMLPLADRLLVLQDGEVQGYGPRDRILELMQKEAQK
jgi:PrtD family type I secretion system ABC transporter